MNEEDMSFVQADIISNHERLKRKLWVHVFEKFLDQGIHTAGSQADQAVVLFDRSCPPGK